MAGYRSPAWCECGTSFRSCSTTRTCLCSARAGATARSALAMLVLLSSETLGDAFRRMVRYERVNFDHADEPATEIVPHGERAHSRRSTSVATISDHNLSKSL
jgi:hypothetical protein